MKNTEAVLVTPGTMEIQETAIPIPKEDEILLKVEYVGICGSDIHGFESGPFIPPKDPNTKIGLGHECAGIVVDIGKRVTNFTVGDKVAIEPGIPCGKCRFCMEGRYNICPSVDFMATQPNYKGALTNYLTHPESLTYHLPKSMDTLEGALVEPAAVGMHAAMEAEVNPGKKIVILGAGCIGLMTLQACKIMGATEIVVVDVIDKRLEKAKELGAIQVVHGIKENVVERVKGILGEWGADIVFETAGSKITASQATQLVMRGGKIMIAGTISEDTPINFLSINREVKIQTVFRYANNYPMTIEAIASKRLDVKSLVTDVYGYKDVQQAFEQSVNGKKEIIKAVIKISE